MSRWFRRRQRKAVITQRDVERLYQRPPSLTDWLPWVDFDPDSRTFTLEDGYSAAIMVEVVGVPTEARPATFLREIQQNIQTCLNHTIPYEDNPFVLQCFVQDEASLAHLSQQLQDYAPNDSPPTELAQHFLKECQAHFKRIANPQGFFNDHAVTGGAWSGKRRRVRIFLYRRRRSPGKGQAEDSALPPNVEIHQVAEKFITQMQAAGIQIRRCGADDLYDWLLRWFNPKAEITQGDLDKLAALLTYPPADQRPFGCDLSTLAMLSQPVSDAATGTWWFDYLPHWVITVDTLRRKPEIGHLTGERRIGENRYAVFDRLPAGSILAMTVILQPQNLVENTLIQILNSAKGETAEAMATERDATQALQWMANGDYLLPTVITLFLRGDNLADLQNKTTTANALLLANGLHPIREKDEQLPLDTYIRQLPMNYEPAREKRVKRARLVFSSDLSRLVPFYGRSRGTGHPGMVFFNRGAEPLTFDPLNKADRAKNAFGLVLGPPGSGKTSLMVYLILLILSLHKARVYIIEKGDSFQLLGEYCKHFGLSVNQVSLRPSQNISLPPFSDARAMLYKP